MSKEVLLSISLILGMNLLFGQTIYVSGSVLYPDGKVPEDTKVYLWVKGEPEGDRIINPLNGEFNIPLPERHISDTAGERVLDVQIRVFQNNRLIGVESCFIFLEEKDRKHQRPCDIIISREVQYVYGQIKNEDGNHLTGFKIGASYPGGVFFEGGQYSSFTNEFGEFFFTIDKNPRKVQLTIIDTTNSYIYQNADTLLYLDYPSTMVIVELKKAPETGIILKPIPTEELFNKSDINIEWKAQGVVEDSITIEIYKKHKLKESYKTTPEAGQQTIRINKPSPDYSIIVRGDTSVLGMKPQVIIKRNIPLFSNEVSFSMGAYLYEDVTWGYLEICCPSVIRESSPFFRLAFSKNFYNRLSLGISGSYATTTFFDSKNYESLESDNFYGLQLSLKFYFFLRKHFKLYIGGAAGGAIHAQQIYYQQSFTSPRKNDLYFLWDYKVLGIKIGHKIGGFVDFNTPFLYDDDVMLVVSFGAHVQF